jgi:CRISPR-associated protein Cmr2
MEIKYFHFSIGPVQGFIAQARRTRDFWAGSFILSWLSAVAMKAVLAQDANNRIDFPQADEDFLLWLENKGKNAKPEHGSVPNRFKASVSSAFNPQAVVEAVNLAWLALANKVYEGDFAALKAEEKTRIIWDRQVKNYWEISWVISNDPADSSALDVRKNWRAYSPPEEAGVKCMMMDGWQELSGADRPNAVQLSKFWEGVQNNGQSGIKTDLRKNEYLCAIAYIKRRFVRYFQQVDQPMAGWYLHGWEVKPGRPSVAYMAAVHWLENVFIQAANYQDIEKQFWKFHDAAILLTGSKYNEWDNQIECIKQCDASHKWRALDGNVFFESALENANIYDDQDQAAKVLAELRALQKLTRQTIPALLPPTPFYAVLMMDGDSLGKQMSDQHKQKTITAGLNTFTSAVPDLVEKHNGFLVYAGGDDVLAVLPLEDALNCALTIRQKYQQIFCELNRHTPEPSRVSTTISAAVVFAHIKMPLGKVLKDAHKLLDGVAKEKYGRDSLAVRVWKPGSLILEWARPWHYALNETQDKLMIGDIASKFAEDDDAYGQLSNRFLYKIRERFDMLNPPSAMSNKAANEGAVLTEEQAIELMAAEYFSSGLCEPYPAVAKLEHAKSVVKPLLAQCRPIYRDEENPDTPGNWKGDAKVLVDAALLVRFIAQKGVNI